MVRQDQKMHAWNQARKLKSDASMRDSAWIRLLKEAEQNGAGGGGILACFYLVADTVPVKA